MGRQPGAAAFSMDVCLALLARARVPLSPSWGWPLLRGGGGFVVGRGERTLHGDGCLSMLRRILPQL